MMNKRTIRELLGLLKQACKDSTFENASCAPFGEQVTTHWKSGPPDELSDRTISGDQYIKERTACYRETWITMPLKEAIEILENALKK